jgi:maltose-binding protein MalE
MVAVRHLTVRRSRRAFLGSLAGGATAALAACGNGTAPAAWALPLETDWRMLSINRDSVQARGLDPDQPPQTTTQLLDWTDKLTQVNADRSLQQIGFWPANGQAFHAGWMKDFGGSYFDEQAAKCTADSQQCVDAFTFARYAGGLQGMRTYTVVHGNIPVLKAVAAAPVFRADPHHAQFMDQLPHAWNRPVTIEARLLWDDLGTAQTNVMNLQADPKSALSDLTQRVNTQLQLDAQH